MPASFKVSCEGDREALIGDFGEHAIARVAPVDSGFWWLLTLQAYVHVSEDRAFLNQAEVQQAIRLVLDLSMTSRFDMFPTMLVPDGSFMIDRRMGVYGYPIDIQAQFFAALCAAADLLDADEPANTRYRDALHERLPHLAHHVRSYYWLDPRAAKPDLSLRHGRVRTGRGQQVQYPPRCHPRLAHGLAAGDRRLSGR